ncbi:hypothetical protein AAG570_005087 [Ranatra chinensis]|uniref:Uncharacterized protein n=1 Tax=Ranatra chinensis TaxID=642074 RepID=A0ABD0YN12_9HEMI
MAISRNRFGPTKSEQETTDQGVFLNRRQAAYGAPPGFSRQEGEWGKRACVYKGPLAELLYTPVHGRPYYLQLTIEFSSLVQDARPLLRRDIGFVAQYLIHNVYLNSK